jgi:death on curing protein
VSSQNSPTWLRLDVVLAIHEAAIADHGGSLGLRDAALLDSALARPRNSWTYSEGPLDIAEIAALYAIGISRNHPFIDGNKRVAFAVLETFLELNGRELNASDAECVTTMWALAAGTLSDADFIGWVRQHASARS